MANFFTRVLKWLAALVVAYFLLFVLGFLFLLVLGTYFQPAPKVIKDNTVLVFDLGFNLTDKPQAEDPGQLLQSALQGDFIESASLREVLNGLKAIREDSRITSVLIRGNILPESTGASFAALREIRSAIQSLADEKPVLAYIDGDSLRDLYLKSAAPRVIANPYSGADFRGLRAELLYMGEAFERIGIEFQSVEFEEYKTAAESFKRATMSEEQRIQLEALVDDLWEVIVSDIAQTRSLEVTALNELANEKLLLMGEDLTVAGLADESMTDNELIELLIGQNAYDNEAKTFRQTGLIDYLEATAPVLPEINLTGPANKVAVVYAQGTLVDGEGTDGVIGGDSLVREFRELRLDDSVKAIVLRVNSPGGSATAGFKVVREMELTNAVKPVVASMAGIATSGGYMISAPAERIFAEPSTITGSIGVVSSLINAEELAGKLSLHFEGVETHRFAGTYSIARAKTPQEMEQVRAFGANVYEDFIDLVASGRGMTTEEVREVARGRVWSGMDALENGLVDEAGGLGKAIQRAADLAGIGDNFRVIERPRIITLEEQLEDLFLSFRGEPFSRPVTKGPLLDALNDVETEIRRLSELNDPYGHHAILPYSLKIR